MAISGKTITAATPVPGHPFAKCAERNTAAPWAMTGRPGGLTVEIRIIMPARGVWKEKMKPRTPAARRPAPKRQNAQYAEQNTASPTPRTATIGAPGIGTGKAFLTVRIITGNAFGTAAAPRKRKRIIWICTKMLHQNTMILSAVFVRKADLPILMSPTVSAIGRITGTAPVPAPASANARKPRPTTSLWTFRPRRPPARSRG